MNRYTSTYHNEWPSYYTYLNKYNVPVLLTNKSVEVGEEALRLELNPAIVVLLTVHVPRLELNHVPSAKGIAPSEPVGQISHYYNVFCGYKV